MILLRNNSFDNVCLRGHVNECILCAANGSPASLRNRYTLHAAC